MPLRLSHPVIRSASAMPCSSSYSASARFHSLRHDLMMIFCTCAAGGKRAWACRRGRHGLTVCYSGGGGGGGRARRALLEGDSARHLLLEAGHLVEDRLRLVQHLPCVRACVRAAVRAGRRAARSACGGVRAHLFVHEQRFLVREWPAQPLGQIEAKVAAARVEGKGG
jgi:hypothetical protein